MPRYASTGRRTGPKTSVRIPPIADIQTFPHSQAMLRALNAAVLCPAFLIISCSSPCATNSHPDINPLVVSEAYAKQHHPSLVPKGIERAWNIEDHGDIWTVELSRQGHVGGGIKMGVRKADGRVLGSELTE